MIGKDASVIAREAGFQAPGAKILVTPVDLVQPEEKLVREKLCPVLAFARVRTIDQAISSARSMMRTSGKGHSAAIHSKNEANIVAFAAAVPALRMVVNAGCSLGAAGYETNLGPCHDHRHRLRRRLVDRRQSHASSPAAISHALPTTRTRRRCSAISPVSIRCKLPKRDASVVELAVGDSVDIELRRELRRIILEELNAVLAA